MSEAARNQFAVDLAELERQLARMGKSESGKQPPAQSQGVAPASPVDSVSDPLAELARIVGDARGPYGRNHTGAIDQIEQLLNKTSQPAQPMVAPQPSSVQPEQVHDFDRVMRDFDDMMMRQAPAAHPANSQSQPVQQQQEDWSLRQSMSDTDYDPRYGAAGYAEPGTEPELAPAPRARSSSLKLAAAVAGVAVLGIAGALALRGGGSQSQAGKAPPIVKADAGPTKLAPEKPGGIDIPDQNKQIFQRGPQNATTQQDQAKLVVNEEQPVDVKAVARQAAPRVVPLTSQQPVSVTSSAPASPIQPVAGSQALPQAPVTPAGASDPNAPIVPRAVRTTTVRPETPATPAATAPQADQTAAKPAAATAPPLRQMVMPTAEAPAKPVAAASPPPAKPRAVPQTTSSIDSSKPLAIEPQAQKNQTRVAAARPAEVASAPRDNQSDVEAPRAPVRTGGGAMMVQLAAEGSNEGARAAFARLKGRFSELSSYSPNIRSAEVNGATVHRLRVGPFSRDEAVKLCESLRAKGGSCFLAAN